MSKKPTHLVLNLRQIALVVGISALVLFLFGYTSRLIASSDLQAEVALWEKEVQLEEQRLQDNQDLLAYSKTDQFVIDKAHSDLGWTFPDEVAVWVLGEESVPVDPALSADGETLPNWQLWQQRFWGAQTGQR